MGDGALLIRVGALGDTIHAASAAILMKRHHPNMRIDFLASSGMGPLFSLIPEVDRVFEFSFSRIPLHVHPGWKRISGTLNRNAYALAYLMETAPRFLPLLDGVRAEKKMTVIGQAGEGAEASIVPVPVRYQRALVREGVVVEGEVPPKLVVPSNLYEEAEMLLVSVGLDPAGTIIGLHAGNSYPRKKRLGRWVKRGDHRSWPEDQWCQLIRALFSLNPELQFLLFGSGLERGINARIGNVVKRAHPGIRLGSTAGRTDLPLAAALLKRFALFIATDSGPLHMAAALGVPLIGLYGPTRYEETRPFALEPDKTAVLRASLPCQPCYGTPMQKRCRENLCMKAIHAEDVVKKSEDLRRDLFARREGIESKGIV